MKLCHASRLALLSGVLLLLCPFAFGQSSIRQMQQAKLDGYARQVEGWQPALEEIGEKITGLATARGELATLTTDLQRLYGKLSELDSVARQQRADCTRELKALDGAERQLYRAIADARAATGDTDLHGATGRVRSTLADLEKSFTAAASAHSGLQESVERFQELQPGPGSQAELARIESASSWALTRAEGLIDPVVRGRGRLQAMKEERFAAKTDLDSLRKQLQATRQAATDRAEEAELGRLERRAEDLLRNLDTQEAWSEMLIEGIELRDGTPDPRRSLESQINIERLLLEGKLESAGRVLGGATISTGGLDIEGAGKRVELAQKAAADLPQSVTSGAGASAPAPASAGGSGAGPAGAAATGSQVPVAPPTPASQSSGAPTGGGHPAAPTAPDHYGGLQITPQVGRIRVGEAVQLRAVDHGGREYSGAVWSGSNTRALAVSSSGMIIGRIAGESAMVMVRVEDMGAILEVTVVGPEEAPASSSEPQLPATGATGATGQADATPGSVGAAPGSPGTDMQAGATPGSADPGGQGNATSAAAGETSSGGQAATTPEPVAGGPGAPGSVAAGPGPPPDAATGPGTRNGAGSEEAGDAQAGDGSGAADTASLPGLDLLGPDSAQPGTDDGAPGGTPDDSPMIDVPEPDVEQPGPEVQEAGGQDLPRPPEDESLPWQPTGDDSNWGTVDVEGSAVEVPGAGSAVEAQPGGVSGAAPATGGADSGWGDGWQDAPVEVTTGSGSGAGGASAAGGAAGGASPGSDPASTGWGDSGWADAPLDVTTGADESVAGGSAPGSGSPGTGAADSGWGDSGWDEAPTAVAGGSGSGGASPGAGGADAGWGDAGWDEAPVEASSGSGISALGVEAGEPALSAPSPSSPPTPTSPTHDTDPLAGDWMSARWAARIGPDGKIASYSKSEEYYRQLEAYRKGCGGFFRGFVPIDERDRWLGPARECELKALQLAQVRPGHRTAVYGAVRLSRTGTGYSGQPLHDYGGPDYGYLHQNHAFPKIGVVAGGTEIMRLRRVAKGRYTGECFVAKDDMGPPDFWTRCTLEAVADGKALLSLYWRPGMYWLLNKDLRRWAQLGNAAPPVRFSGMLRIRGEGGAAQPVATTAAGADGSGSCWVGCEFGVRPLRCAVACDGQFSATTALARGGHTDYRLKNASWERCAEKMRELGQAGW